MSHFEEPPTTAFIAFGAPGGGLVDHIKSTGGLQGTKTVAIEAK